jgi:hypothetical protein
MQTLDDRLARWQACLDRASQNADQAAQQALAEEAALGEWIGRLGAMQAKLASQGPPGASGFRRVHPMGTSSRG